MSEFYDDIAIGFVIRPALILGFLVSMALAAGARWLWSKFRDR